MVFTANLFDKELNLVKSIVSNTGTKGQVDWIGGEFFALTDGSNVRIFRLDVENETCQQVKNLTLGNVSYDGIAMLRDRAFGQYGTGEGDGEIPEFSADRAVVMRFSTRQIINPG